MNYSTAVMLINEEIRAISCSYEPDVLRGDGDGSGDGYGLLATALAQLT